MGPFRDDWSNEDVEAVLLRGDPEELFYVPIVVGTNAPACGAEWAEQVCVRLSSHPNPTVRGNALLGIGHIARTCLELRDVRSVQAVQQGQHDLDPYVRGHSEDAISDIKHFLKSGVSELISRLAP
ncbi:hypothetical protein [Accumulibacter sp.]|uniref:hypothetical protein n=1 Tax=Accumulibacter sp. TaxID=2053492 RepID=UPI0035B2CCC3